jgi:hypothetical protein
MNRQAVSNVIEIIDMNDDEPQVVPVIITRDVPIARRDHSIPTPLPDSLIQSLCASLKELRRGRCLLLPVKKICNVNSEVSIAKENKNTYIFNIGPTQFSVAEDSLYETIYNRQDDDETRNFSEDEFIEHVVKNTLTDLKKIKIDNLNGQFITTEQTPKAQKLDEMWSEFCQEFKDDEHIEMIIKECCVCFTMTKTTTNCGHTVCLECISKLKTEPVSDDATMRSANHIGCPMCRQRILCLL